MDVTFTEKSILRIFPTTLWPLDESSDKPGNLPFEYTRIQVVITGDRRTLQPGELYRLDLKDPNKSFLRTACRLVQTSGTVDHKGRIRSDAFKHTSHADPFFAIAYPDLKFIDNAHVPLPTL